VSEQEKPSDSRNTVVRKLHAVMATLFDPDISKSAAAVLSCLAEHANRDTGLAWPGHGLLAIETGLSKRQVTRAMQDLREARYIVVAEESRPARTARYRLSYKGADRVDEMFDWSNRNPAASNSTRSGNEGGDIRVTEGGDVRVTTKGEGVVTSLSKGGDNDGSKVVTAMSSEPTHRTPTMKEGEVVGGSIGSGPGGPSLAAPTKEMFDLFWTVYPKGEHKHQGECELRAQLAAGVSFEDIVDGARRYTQHCRAKHTDYRYVPYARNWLRDQRWRDAYRAPEPEPAPERIPTNQTKGKKSGAKPSKAKTKIGQVNVDQRIRREEMRVREIAWEGLSETEWRSRVAGIEPLVKRMHDQFPARLNGGGLGIDLKALGLAVKAYLLSQRLSANYRQYTNIAATIYRVDYCLRRHEQPHLSGVELFEGDSPLPIRVLEHYRSVVGADRDGL
jgi:hypothetical protein